MDISRKVVDKNEFCDSDEHVLPLLFTCNMPVFGLGMQYRSPASEFLRASDMAAGALFFRFRFLVAVPCDS